MRSSEGRAGTDVDDHAIGIGDDREVRAVGNREPIWFSTGFAVFEVVVAFSPGAAPGPERCLGARRGKLANSSAMDEFRDGEANFHFEI